MSPKTKSKNPKIQRSQSLKEKYSKNPKIQTLGGVTHSLSQIPQHKYEKKTNMNPARDHKQWKNRAPLKGEIDNIIYNIMIFSMFRIFYFYIGRNWVKTGLNG